MDSSSLNENATYDNSAMLDGGNAVKGSEAIDTGSRWIYSRIPFSYAQEYNYLPSDKRRHQLRVYNWLEPSNLESTTD